MKILLTVNVYMYTLGVPLKIYKNMNSKWIPLHIQEDDAKNRYIVKFRFESSGYTVFLSNASSIWSESLSHTEIISRATEEDCSITPSDDDPNQLTILLKKLEDVFHARDGATFKIDDSELTKQISLRTESPLPKPLPPLTWFFDLKIGPADSMRTELVLPLLTLSYTQTQHISQLTSELLEKDNAVSRILDKLDAKNIELKSIFPTVPIARTSRRDITRGDVAEHVKGLRPFDHRSWQKTVSSGQQVDYDDLVVGAFQNASNTNITVQGFDDDHEEARKRRILMRAQSSVDGFQVCFNLPRLVP